MSAPEQALSQLRSLEALARRDTPLGRVDARAKVWVVLVLLGVTASYDRLELLRLLPLLAFLAAGMALGDIPLRLLATRLLVAAPFAVLVGVFNPVFETAPVAVLWGVSLSAGWISLASILLRFVIAVGAVLVLVASTGFDASCLALGRLGAPRVLVTQLLLLYRYVFALVDDASRMLRAHALRSPQRPRPTLSTARTLMSQLLLRSIARAERVHAAMLCRGFRGALPVKSLRFRSSDAAFAVLWTAYILLVRLVDAPGLLARLFT